MAKKSTGPVARDKTAGSLKGKFDKTHPHSIFTGKEIEGMIVPRIPSGSFVFDMVTAGGIPKNRLTGFHGPKSSGKTTFSLRLAGMFQTLHPNLSVVYADFENSFEWDWAKSFIANPDQFYVIKPDYGEEGIDMTLAYAMEAEDVGLVIIDSLAGIIPTAEAEADAADYTQLGLQVRLINRMIRRMLVYQTQVSKQGGELTVLTINQIRANMNRTGPYGPAHSQPGGKLLEHALSMDIKFYPGEYDKVQNVPVKVKHKFQVDKNKVGLPKRSGEIAYYLLDTDGRKTGEMDEEKVVVTYAKRAGVLVRDGNKWVIPMKKGDALTFGSMVELIKHLNANQKLFASLKAATVKACIDNPLLSADEAGE